jgi:hypothetical protein
VAIAGWQPGVADDDPNEPISVLRNKTKADEPAPVLAEERDVVKVQLLEHELAHPLHVVLVRVRTAISAQ